MQTRVWATLAAVICVAGCGGVDDNVSVLTQAIKKSNIAGITCGVGWDSNRCNGNCAVVETFPNGMKRCACPDYACDGPANTDAECRPTGITMFYLEEDCSKPQKTIRSIAPPTTTRHLLAPK